MPATKRDYYEVLGVGRGASADEVKASYRRLAKEHHPDRNPDDRAGAEEKFKELSEAYEVLADSDKRRLYDQYGHEGVSRRFGPGGFDFNRDFTHSEDLGDIFGDLLRGFGGAGSGGGLFDLLFGGGTTRRAERGGNIRIAMQLPLEEIAESVTKQVSFQRWEACPKCSGRGGTGEVECRTCSGSGQVRHRASSLFGQFVQVSACPDCGGAGASVKERCQDCGATGRVRKARTLKVKIPAGVSTGNYLTLEGEGHFGPGGPGAVVVEISEKPHELFRRQEDDVVVDLPVSFATAAFGGKAKVPTLKGEKEIEVPAGTQPGTVLRIRGAGIRHLQGGTGDQLVRVLVHVPRKLSREEKKLLQELDKARTETVPGPRKPE